MAPAGSDPVDLDTIDEGWGDDEPPAPPPGPPANRASEPPPSADRASSSPTPVVEVHPPRSEPDAGLTLDLEELEPARRGRQSVPRLPMDLSEMMPPAEEGRAESLEPELDLPAAAADTAPFSLEI